jgi:hypothetical protein
MARQWILPGIAVLVLTGEIVSYFLGARTPAPITGEGLSIVVTAAVIMLASVFIWHRKEAHWWLLAVSFCWFAAGASVNYAYLRIDGAYPFPGPADVLFLLIYPWAIAAFIAFIRIFRLKVSIWDVLVSLTVTALAVGLLLYPFVIGPSSRLHASVFTRAVTIAYPCADALVLFIAMIMLLAAVSDNILTVARWLVVAGTIALLIADSASAYQSLNWVWLQPSAINLGWYVWAGTWALAAIVSVGKERAEADAGG